MRGEGEGLLPCRAAGAPSHSARFTADFLLSLFILVVYRIYCRRWSFALRNGRIDTWRPCSKTLRGNVHVRRPNSMGNTLMYR